MENENFNDISIPEITREAGIARRTFYLNSESKQDILDQHYSLLMKEYDDGLSAEINGSFKKQAVYFFSFWKKHQSYALLLEKNGMFHMLMNRFRFFSEQNTELYLRRFPQKRTGLCDGKPDRDLMDDAGEWMRRGFQESPAEIADVFLKISGSFSAYSSQ